MKLNHLIIFIIFSFIILLSCGKNNSDKRTKAINEIYTIESYIQSAGLKQKSEDTKGAIIDLQKASELVEKYNSNKSEFDIGEDLYEDLNKKAKRIYVLRGLYNIELNNLDDAITDLSKAIAIEPNKNSYLLRGNCYFAKGLYKYDEGSEESTNKLQACDDWNKAKDLGDNEARKMIQKYCN